MPVTISAEADDRTTPLSIDVRGLKAVGAGPTWISATAVAQVQSVLIAGVDPRAVQVRYSLQEAIDGPSAGGLLSAGTLAVINRTGLSRTTTMSGTVLPDGSVGPVSGLPEKLRAAKAAGFTRVLVPVGPARDLRTGVPVDLAALGRSLGVTVVPVKSVPEAYALLTDSPATPAMSTPPPIEPGVLAMLARRSRPLIASAATDLRRLALSGDPDARRAVPTIRGWLGTAEQALARQDPILAFTAASEAAQAVREAREVDRLRTEATRTPLAERVDEIRREAAQLATEIREDVRTTAELPVTKIAQLTALPDVLAWGTFAMSSLEVAQQRLQTVGSESDLEQLVRFIEAARFEAETYMPATAEALQYIGTSAITDVERSVGLLDAYTDLIAYGANANREYASSLRPPTGGDTYLLQLIQESHERTAASAADLQGLRSPTAAPALRMSAALLEYVETTQLVNDLTSRQLGADGPPNLLPIRNPAAVRTQATAAAEIATSQARVIAAAGLDASYLQWNSRWGEQLAFGRLPGTTDEQTLHGLEYQWFAVLQSRLLIALSPR